MLLIGRPFGRPFLRKPISQTLQSETVKIANMNYAEIISKLQDSIFSAQRVLEELRCLDSASADDIYITRQEAADLMGKSMRQMDRDCKRYGIRRKPFNNGIRISKRDVLCHIGVIQDSDSRLDKLSDFERIYNGISRR